MAKTAAAPEASQRPQRRQQGRRSCRLIMAMLVLTGLSVGAGGMFGLQVLSKAGRPPPPAAEGRSEGRRERQSGASRRRPRCIALSPIVTNLASPERTWIRLEASIVIDGEGRGRQGAVCRRSPRIWSPTCAPLSLPLIEGASGLQHLREDLNDRARIRSGGKVRET